MNESLWLDEATTALVSKMSLNDIFFKFLPGDFHPPLYYLLMKFWVNIFGNSEFSLRVPSLIFTLLTIYLIYRFFGKLSAVLLAFSPLLFYYSMEARMYTMAMFLTVFLIIYFIKIIKNGSKADWIIFSILLPLVFLTDYVAFLVVPGLWLGAIFVRKRNIWWKKFILLHIPLLVTGAFWFPIFKNQLNGGFNVLAINPAWSNVLGKTSFKNLALIPVKFMIGRVGFDNKLIYILVVGFLGLLFALLMYKGRKAAKVIWLWLIIPITLAAILSFRISILSYFRFLFILPAFYIIVSEGVKRLGKYANLVTALILGINLTLIGYYLLNPKFHHEDWRAASKAIGSDQIVLPADSQTEALIYYGKYGQIVKNPTGSTIWLSRYVVEIFDPEDLVRKNIEKLGYNKVSEYNFNGVVFWKYTK